MTPLLHDWTTADVWPALAMLSRAAAFAAIAPLPAAGRASFRQRAVVAVVLALLLIPAADRRNTESQAPRVNLMLADVAVGLVLGLSLQVLMVGIGWGMQLVEQQLAFDPTGTTTDDAAGAIGRLYQLVAVLVFLLAGGHRVVIAALVETRLEGTLDGVATLAQPAVSLLTHATWLALRAAAPLVLALLSANVAAAMVARVLPVASSPGLMLPAQIALGLILLLVSLGPFAAAIENELAGVLVPLPAADAR